MRTVLAAAAVALVGPAGFAQEVRPTRVLVTGGLDGVDPGRFAPPGGVVADRKAFEALWKDWLLADDVPAVDFATQVVVVGTTKDGPVEAVALVPGAKKGDLVIKLKLDRRAPGGVVHCILATFPRKDVPMVEGKPVPRN